MMHCHAGEAGAGTALHLPQFKAKGAPVSLWRFEAPEKGGNHGPGGSFGPSPIGGRTASACTDPRPVSALRSSAIFLPLS